MNCPNRDILFLHIETYRRKKHISLVSDISAMPEAREIFVNYAVKETFPSFLVSLLNRDRYAKGKGLHANADL